MRPWLKVRLSELLHLERPLVKVCLRTYPLAFASMYGDAAADQLGYRPLGLPPRAGFEVAVADALARRVEPVSRLE